MRLIRLIYASTIKADTDPSELAKIHEVADEKNGLSSISGLLVFGDDYFLQALEGGREAVNALYHRIMKDPRHTKIVLLEYGDISVRQFEDWRMKLVLLTEKKSQLVKRFSATEKFNPYEMTAPTALSFLQHLRTSSP